MQAINCRLSKRRIQLVSEYKITPMAHVRLLNGQEKMSCTNVLLTDTYYCFSYEHRETREQGYFFCGDHAAEDFLSLTGENQIPLFDPIRNIGAGANESRGNQGGSVRRQWDGTAKQLYDAINLLVICWNIIPGGKLSEIKSNLDAYYFSEPFAWKIKLVNNILSKDARNRTLQEMIAELREKNNIRDYSFDSLNEILSEEGEDSYFG